MHFIPMDPELARKAIEGYQDELTAEAEKLDAFYRQFVCPNCGGKCRREISVSHAFADEDTIVPRSILRCVQCSCLFDPHSGLILERGGHITMHCDFPNPSE
jgi:hypothetical protein